MISNSYEAAKISGKVSVFAMDQIKPIDKNMLQTLTTEYKIIIVVEDNFNSGLYNSVCQFVVESHTHDLDVYSISPDESYGNYVGDTAYLDDLYGLTPDKINKFIEKITK